MTVKTSKMMKNVRLILALSFVFGMMFTSKAQKEDWGSDSTMCRQCVSLYGQPMQQGNYEEAVIHWRCVIKVCPKLKESIYINGAILYRYFIDKELDKKEGKDEAKVNAYIDTLVWVYEKQMEYFGRTSETLERYGNDLLRYRQSKPDQSNKILKELLEREKEKTSCVALMRYYQSLYIMYRYKLQGVDTNKMIEDYFMVKGYLETYTKENPNDPNCKKAEEEVDRFGEQFLSCDKLVPAYQKKYNELPKEKKEERLAQMKKMLELLNKKNCNDNELFEAMVKEVVELDPSHEGYYNLGIIMMNKKKYSDANGYFKKALELCGDCPKIEEYLMGAAAANLNAGSLSTAASYARQSLTKNSKNGEAYLIIAQAIARSGCGDNDFQRKWVYWLAVDYAQKAKSVDPSVNDRANSLISQYRSRFPEKRELFEYGLLDKETVTIGCWINEEVRIVKE